MDDKYEYNEVEENKNVDHTGEGNAQEQGVNFILHDVENTEEKTSSHQTSQSVENDADSMDQKCEEFIINEEKKEDEARRSGKGKRGKESKGTLKKIGACVGFAVLFGVVACMTFQAGNHIVGKAFASKNHAVIGNEAEVNKTKVAKTTNTVTSDVTDIVKNAMPSVVSITNMSVQEVRDYFGGVHETENQSSGSGIIIGKNNEELLILTNNHVIEGSTKLTVSFIDNESVEGVVKGNDPNRDIAIVAVPLQSIKNDTMGKITVATIGDSTKLQVGEPAIAIGNALGYGQSVTTGIVSATDRELDGFEGKLIQTDAAINPGNSGGALLNANGEVIGINTVKINMEAVEGIGYAIPLSDISNLLEVLMNKETRTRVEENERGFIGITGFDVTEESGSMYNMPLGIYVSEVLKHGGADKAGVIKGSIITGFEGIEVSGMDELQAQLQYYKAGEKVKVTLQVPADKGTFEEKTVEITLQKK